MRAYGEKENRHSSVIQIVLTEQAQRHLSSALDYLQTRTTAINMLDEALTAALLDADSHSGEATLRDLATKVPRIDDVQEFVSARGELTQAMAQVGKVISGMWTTDRYVRAHIEDDT